jgi:hypothetical protein
MARRTDTRRSSEVRIPFSNASLSASSTQMLWKVPAGRQLVIDRVSYINPTGLAGDTTNTFRCEVKKGSTVSVTVFNTDTNDTPAGVALAAGVAAEGTPSSTAADLWFAAGDRVDVVFTLEGTQTLPVGAGMIEGRLL